MLMTRSRCDRNSSAMLAILSQDSDDLNTVL